jgi:hypothetical protein
MLGATPTRHLLLAAVFLGAGCDAFLPALVGCPTSRPAEVGRSWSEIGGPNAHFHVDPTSLRASRNPYLVFTRVQPDPADMNRLGVYIERLDGSNRVAAFVNSRMNPAGIQDAPQLPGGWYLVELTIPAPGCWRVVAAVDGEPVGTAIVDAGEE